jgi:hypothetical protein
MGPTIRLNEQEISRLTTPTDLNVAHEQAMRRRLLLAPVGIASPPCFSHWYGRAVSEQLKLRIGVVWSHWTIGGLWVRPATLCCFRRVTRTADGPARLACAGQARGRRDQIRRPHRGAVRGASQIGRDYGAALKGRSCSTQQRHTSRDGVFAWKPNAMRRMTSQRTCRHAPRACSTTALLDLRLIGPARMAMPIAGDDAEALKVAEALVRDAGFEPVVVGKLSDAVHFQRGGPGYGQAVTAAELRKTLSLTP